MLWAVNLLLRDMINSWFLIKTDLGQNQSLLREEEPNMGFSVSSSCVSSMC